MIFNSVDFLIAFPIGLALYHWAPYSIRWILLLGLSLVFYLWLIPAYFFVVLTLVLTSYLGTLWVDQRSGRGRKWALAVTIALTLIPLIGFKYFDFFGSNLETLARLIGWNYSHSWLALALPLGLSFQTFQALSYSIEVYRRDFPVERHLGYYALYILFFPQLAAGPIERPQALLPQLRAKHTFHPDDMTWGLRWILWGLFKKVVVADRLAALVNEIYAAPTEFSTYTLLPATVAFGFQIYCDFSGYSDIARGVSRTFGIRLMQNFEQPYLAASIGDFWRRWHISLSTWFRDYVYFPLGGNRGSAWLHLRNVLIVFLVSGLWHGANWTFLAWGLFHAVGFALTLVLVQIRLPQLTRGVLGTVLTFGFVTVGWVFFRANSMQDAWYILGHLFDFETSGRTPVWGRATVWVGTVGVAVLMTAEWFLERGRIQFSTIPIGVRWAGYWGLTLAILNLGGVAHVPFIYFQF